MSPAEKASPAPVGSTARTAKAGSRREAPGTAAASPSRPRVTKALPAPKRRSSVAARDGSRRPVMEAASSPLQWKTSVAGRARRRKAQDFR